MGPLITVDVELWLPGFAIFVQVLLAQRLSFDRLVIFLTLLYLLLFGLNDRSLESHLGVVKFSVLFSPRTDEPYRPDIILDEVYVITHKAILGGVIVQDDVAL